MTAIRELGLTGYEEKVYRALLAKGPSPVKDISSVSGVPPTAVYPAMKSLAEKGAVQRIDGDTQVYEAVSVKIAVKQLLARKVAALKEASELAEDELSSIERDEEVAPTPIQLTKGMSSSMSHSETIVDETRKTFYVVGWNTSKMASVPRIVKRARAMKKRGVDVRFIFTRQSPSGKVLRKELKKLGVDYRCKPMGLFSLVISDAKQCKITLKQPALAERLNMMVGDQDLAGAMHGYFLSLWKQAKSEF